MSRAAKPMEQSKLVGVESGAKAKSGWVMHGSDTNDDGLDGGLPALGNGIGVGLV